MIYEILECVFQNTLHSTKNWFRLKSVYADIDCIFILLTGFSLQKNYVYYHIYKTAIPFIQIPLKYYS